MANYKTLVSFIISHPFKKFKGNSSRNLSSFLEIGTGPKAAAPFQFNYCSDGEKLVNRGRRSDFDELFREIANLQQQSSVARSTELLQALTKTRDYSASVEHFQRIVALGGVAPADSDTIKIVIEWLCQMHHRTREGFAVLGYGLKSGVVPNVAVFSRDLLDGLILEDKFLEAGAFFKKLLEEANYAPSRDVYTNIIKGLCRFGLHDAAIDMAKLMDERYDRTNVVAYETIVVSLCKDEQMVDEALQLFREMVLQKSMKPDDATYSTLLYSLCNLSRKADISNLHTELEDTGCHLSLEVRNIFVHVYCKLLRMKDAERVAKLMHPGLRLDTFKALIDAYSSLGDVTQARHYFDLLRLTQARHYFDLLRPSGMNANVHIYNTLLKGYFKDPLALFYIEEAFCLFDDMTIQGAEPNLATWHIMLEGLFEVGRWSRGLKLFMKMLVHSKHHLRPNSITYTIVLQGLCDNIKLEEALSLFHFITNNNKTKKRLENEVALCNILIHRATNSGKLDTARNLFNELTSKGLQPDGRTYSLMIAGFCVEGLIEEAKQLFLEMKEKGFRPDKLACYILFRRLPKIQQLDIADKVIQEMEGSGFPLDEQTKVLIYDGKDG